MTVQSAANRLRGELSSPIRVAEPMARHTTWGIGGPAAVLCVLDTMHDAKLVLEVLTEEEVPWTVVGKGSNLLVSDSGYPGAVLVLGREFKQHAVENGVLRAGAAIVLGHLVQDAFSTGLAGLVWAVGIPGTLGGALAMNAGTAEGCVGQMVDTVTLLTPDGRLQLVHGRDVSWEYRRSGLAGRGIILEAALRVGEQDPVRTRLEMERNLKHRKATQPLGSRSAGSVFVNPPGDHAGRLVEAAGLKGKRVGGARVSPLHANFIVNEGGATAADVVSLVHIIQTTVRNECGVDLRPEIRFLGTFEEA